MEKIVLDVSLDKCEEDQAEHERPGWRDGVVSREMMLFQKYVDKHGLPQSMERLSALNSACYRAVQERKNRRIA